MAKGNRPVYKTKFGTVEVCGWERDSEKYGVQLTFSMSKSYKQGEEWKTQVFYFSNTTEMQCALLAINAALTMKFSKAEKPAATEPDDNDSPI